jgi:hypothetical protein
MDWRRGLDSNFIKTDKREVTAVILHVAGYPDGEGKKSSTENETWPISRIRKTKQARRQRGGPVCIATLLTESTTRTCAGDAGRTIRASRGRRASQWWARERARE